MAIYMPNAQLPAPKVWLLVPDYGTEGLGEPHMAFHSKECAEDAMALIAKNPSATTMRLVEVPVWRHR